MTKKPSTDPYKGVRDFYPENQFVQNYIFDIWRKIAQSLGYEEYNTSILEPTELYTAKTSEEIVSEQTYTFTDRGDRSVTLRPEMTPSVARMVARKRRELAFPLRWFSIGNMFRYERPQRGRLREHWQLNADLFGAIGIEADTEIISLAYNIMRTFGVDEKNFAIKINNRGTVLRALTETGMSETEAEKELTQIDKGTSSVNLKSDAPDIHTEKVISALQKSGVKNAVFDPMLVRGFSYYTGIVFEVFDTNPKNSRSLFGGGRYDNLVEAYGGESVPAAGFAVGDVTMRDVLETYNLLPEYKPATMLCICYADKNIKEQTDAIVRSLRQKGLNVAAADTKKKVGDQIKYADKLRIPFVLCIGPKELESNNFTIKELVTGDETVLKQDEIAAFILDAVQ